MKKKKQNSKKQESDEEIDNNSENSDNENNKKSYKGNYYIFATTNKKKLISVPKSSKQPDTQLEIDNFTKGGSKQFEIQPTEDNYYTIKSCLSDLYLKIKEGFKHDEVVQDEYEDSEVFKWLIQDVEGDDKCVYIKSAISEQDLYMQIEDGEAKLHAKIIAGEFDEEQKFMLCRKV